MYNQQQNQGAEPVEWRGFYMGNGQKVPMVFQNITFLPDGSITGNGNNSSGPYNVIGRALINGDFQFRLLSHHGAPEKIFVGQLIGDGSLKGTFTTQGFPPSHFEIRTKRETWNGTYVQNGRKKELRLDFNASKFIFGLGRDTTGLFVINGNVDTTSYTVRFVKSYPSKFQVNYQGNMVNNGIFWVINGTWSIGSNQSGNFEIYKEAPQQQKFQPDPGAGMNSNLGGMMNQAPMGGMGGFTPPMNPMASAGMNSMGMASNMNMNSMGMNSMGMMSQPQPVIQQQPQVIVQPVYISQQQPMMVNPAQQVQSQLDKKSEAYSKYSLPKDPDQNAIDKLFDELVENNYKMKGEDIAYFIRKFNREKPALNFLDRIPRYAFEMTLDDLVNTVKRTTYLEVKVKAIKSLSGLVKPTIDGVGMRRVLELIVFNQERDEIAEFFEAAFGVEPAPED